MWSVICFVQIFAFFTQTLTELETELTPLNSASHECKWLYHFFNNIGLNNMKPAAAGVKLAATGSFSGLTDHLLVLSIRSSWFLSFSGQAGWCWAPDEAWGTGPALTSVLSGLCQSLSGATVTEASVCAASCHPAAMSGNFSEQLSSVARLQSELLSVCLAKPVAAVT